MASPNEVPVIAISGAAGSGKTTLGRVLARAWGGVVVDLDEVALDITAKALEGSPEPSTALAAIRDQRYAELYERIRQERARLVGPIVAVAPFTEETKTPAAWAEFAERIGGGEVHLVWVRVDPQDRAARIQRRGADRDRARNDLDEDLPAPAASHTEVDGRLSTAQQVAALRSRFGNGR